MKRDLTELKKALSETDIADKLEIKQINKIIQSLILIHNPLRANLPRKPGSGPGSYINQRSALPTAESVADTDDFTASESTYGSRLEFKFKTIGCRGKVTRKAQAIGRTYTDLKTQEINACLDATKDREENLIVNGDAVANVKDFSGVDTLITSAGQIVTAGANGAELTLEMLDETIDACYGMPDMIIVSKRSRRALNGLLQINQRFVDKVEVKGGFKLLAYNDIPIFWSTKISDAQTQGTATNCSTIFVLDTTKLWIEVLTELRMEPLAKKSSQYDEFDVFEDEVLTLANEKYNSKLVGVKPA